MAEKKEKVSDIGGPSSTAFIMELFTEVLFGSRGMAVAEQEMITYINGLPEEQRAQTKVAWQTMARRIMQVAEGFSQQLTVLSSR